MAEMIRRGPTGMRRRRPTGIAKGPSLFSWDPFEELRETQQHLSDLFENLMPAEWAESETFAPLVDVKEEDNNVVVSADMPGVNKEDVDINVRDDMVEINAQHKEESESEEEGFYRKERTYRAFSRAVPLPASVTEEGASAKLEDGVLKITLPKASEKEEKKITVE
ncbi:Hsp20/alpha crystallin family protein [Methanohalobium sp.]|uniref:Hsp20/alpha crystallin family protein n=1 Tax=Methanohalobium sp. TaxID=2837493 RepID=UPI0025DEF5A3|nr:Hsp20/alpha crystallin family protein [Methanohalobium sp.]